MKTQHLILKLFNSAIPASEVKPFDSFNKLSMAYGYIVHKDICNDEVLDWIKLNHRDLGSTFYKVWNDVILKTRWELFVDQVQHYASTYGTDFQGKVYLPEGISEIPDFSSFKVIKSITKDEVEERCLKMLYSGIAISQETIQELLSILDYLDSKIDVELVKNREVKLFLHVRLDTLPKEPVEMVRYLVYKAIGKTLLIKDRETINSLKVAQVDLVDDIKRFGIDKLSTVFFRFKPIFLAIKDSTHNRVINKLRRAAVKNHKPMKSGYFETLLSGSGRVDFSVDLDLLKTNLDKITNFKKVTLLQTIKKRLKRGLESDVYVIRNQKVWIDEDRKSKYQNNLLLKEVYKVIYDHLVNSLRKKACTISLPNKINITIPTSGKSFIGNYPIGTSIDFSKKDNVFGINWGGEDGADDLDLSIVDYNGNKLGWNSAYYNDSKSLIFSGDMTSANPEATELFYASGEFVSGIAKVNLYHGHKDSKFKFFIAREKVVNMERGYMIDPNNIIASIDCIMDSKEKSLGIISDNKFVMTVLRTGNRSVSRARKSDSLIDYTLKTLDCYLSLKEVLIDAGFVITDKDPEIDLKNNLSKDSLINLFS